VKSINVRLSRAFLKIGSLVFSEFLHEVRGLKIMEPDFQEKTIFGIFCPKLARNKVFWIFLEIVLLLFYIVFA